MSIKRLTLPPAFRMFVPVGLLLTNALVVSLPAQASVIFQIERVSDTVGILTGTGTLGDTVPAVPKQVMFALDSNPFGIAPTGTDNRSVWGSGAIPTTLTIDNNVNYKINFAYEAGPGLRTGMSSGPVIYFGNSSAISSFPPSSFVSGVLELNLASGTTWAPIGKQGSVLWGLYGSEGATNIGSWEIVGSVPPPIPGSLLFRESAFAFKEGTWLLDVSGSNVTPGFDHVGFNYNNKVYEAHPGYQPGTYVNAAGSEQVNVNNSFTVQAQHTKGTFLNDAKQGETSPIVRTLEIQIESVIADQLAAKLQTKLGAPFSQIGGFTLPEQVSQLLRALSPEIQKGGEGAFTCVGLIEWAAESIGLNDGEGFIPNIIEAGGFLSPSMLSYAVQARDVMDQIQADTIDFFTGIFDPVDFILTDPLGRRIGYSTSTGLVNEIPGAFYSGDGLLEQLLIPDILPGLYTLELYGLGEDYAVILGEGGTTLVDSRGFLGLGERRLLEFVISADATVPTPSSVALLLFAIPLLLLRGRSSIKLTPRLPSKQSNCHA